MIMLAAGVVVSSCNAGDGKSHADGDGGSGGWHPLGGNTGTGGSGNGSASDCSQASKLVYVIDEDAKLYSFDPTMQNVAAFKPKGTLNCQGVIPNSMSVSREGFAYVLYGIPNATFPLEFQCQGVHQVDIETAECLGPTPFNCGASGFQKFGMGYATTAPGATSEELFLGNSVDAQLAVLDVATGGLELRGTLFNAGAEFTGNANGELWGFFPREKPPAIARINKTTGEAIQTFSLDSLPSTDQGDFAAWAFAYWGGSFFIFYMVHPIHSSSRVFKFEYDGTISDFMGSTGLTIVGAGVSTCAPITPPR